MTMGLTKSDELQLSTPLVHHSQHSAIKRTGTTWTAVAHIITGVIGSGVLSLAWSMAQLGWIAGPSLMLFFAVITLISTFLMCDCYRSTDPEHGPIRNRSYTEAVEVNLGQILALFFYHFLFLLSCWCLSFIYVNSSKAGEKSAWISGVLMQINFYGTGVAYVITSATCLSAIQKSNCYHKYGHDAPCEFGDTNSMLVFGAVQILMSQIPNLHSMGWLSVIAAVMSIAYSTIGLGLGAAQVIGDGVILGSIDGISTSSSTQKFWLVFQALGDIAFAYPFTMIVLNIQDTLRSPPPETETMKRASVISISVTTFFYLCCGGFGYAAFGDQTPGNLLTGFGFYEPYWLIDFANACIVVHLIGGYQMYSQPMFAIVEEWLQGTTLVNKRYTLKLPLMPALNLDAQRLCFRTVYVVSTTAIAMAFPYFNQVLGVLGAINFWPMAIYFPVEMCLRREGVEAWTRKWIVLRGFSAVCFVLTMLALIASIQGLITQRFSSSQLYNS